MKYAEMSIVSIIQVANLALVKRTKFSLILAIIKVKSHAYIFKINVKAN